MLSDMDATGYYFLDRGVVWMRYLGRSPVRTLSPSQIEKRAKRSGWLIVSGYTIRQTADMMGVSKSTVAKDLDRLIDLDKELYAQVRDRIKRTMEITPYVAGAVTKLRCAAKRNEEASIKLTEEIQSRLLSIGIYPKCGAKLQYVHIQDLSSSLRCNQCSFRM